MMFEPRVLNTEETRRQQQYLSYQRYYERNLDEFKRAPGTIFGYESMGLGVRRYLDRYRKAVEGQDGSKRFVFFVHGIPGAGKDHIIDMHLNPLFTAFLDRMSLERDGIPQLTYVAWDRIEEDLYYKEQINTPVGVPYTLEELDAVSEEMMERIYEGLKVPGGMVLVNMPGGIELYMHEKNWLSSGWKKYGDQIPDRLIRREGVFRNLKNEEVIIANAGVIPGPWLLVEMYYRWAIMSSGFMKRILTGEEKAGILEDANRINEIFHKPTFITVAELTDFLNRRGGSPYQVYEAQKISWNILNERFPEARRQFKLPEELEEQIDLIAELFDSDPEWVRKYTRLFLSLSRIYIQNMHLDSEWILQPDYAFLPFNNPFVNIKPESVPLLSDYLKGLRRQEKEYVAMFEKVAGDWVGMTGRAYDDFLPVRRD